MQVKNWILKLLFLNLNIEILIFDLDIFENLEFFLNLECYEQNSN